MLPQNVIHMLLSSGLTALLVRMENCDCYPHSENDKKKIAERLTNDDLVLQQADCFTNRPHYSVREVVATWSVV